MGQFEYKTDIIKSEEDEKMKGYRPSDKERSEGQPEEQYYAKNRYGIISAGKSVENENIFVFTGKKKKDGSALTEEEKVLYQQTAKRPQSRVQDMYVNEDREETDAFEYRSQDKNSSALVMKNLMKNFSRNDVQMKDRTMPFMNKDLNRKKLEKMRTEYQHSGVKDKAKEKKLEAFADELAGQEREFLRFRKQLDEVVNEMNEKHVYKDFPKKVKESILESILSDGSEEGTSATNLRNRFFGRDGLYVVSDIFSEEETGNYLLEAILALLAGLKAVRSPKKRKLQSYKPERKPSLLMQKTMI